MLLLLPLRFSDVLPAELVWLIEAGDYKVRAQA